MKIAIYGKRLEDENKSIIRLLFELFKSNKIDFLIHQNFRTKIEEFNLAIDQPILYYKNHGDLKQGVNFLITIGGDGTFLDTILLVRNLNIPILGINTGRLGFLSNTPPKDIKYAIKALINNDYNIEKRALLRLESEQKLFGRNNHALNEISVLKSDSSSMITIHVTLNGNHLNSYWTDGLIISTATGSTAYSLSCGGPIMMPGSGNFVITPIAPHNLNVRPIVVDDDTEVSLVVESRSEKNLVALDSRSLNLKNGEKLIIRKADYKISILQFKNQSFVNSLRNKLNWGLDQRNG